MCQQAKKALIEINREYWKNKPQVFAGDKWIYVYHCLSSNMEYSIHESIVALGLQAQEHLPIKVVTDGRGGEFQDELDVSFGTSDIYHLIYRNFTDDLSESRADKAAQNLADTTYGHKDKLFQMEYRGILCGDAIHDEILRREMGRVFDCFAISKEEYQQYIKDAISTIDKAFELFEKQPPAYIVTAESLCLKGLLSRVAQEYEADILVISNDYPDTVMKISPDRKLFQDFKMSELLQRQIENYLYRNPEIQAEGGNCDLFVYETEPSREGERLLQQLGITNDNKNVFILLHVFSDCPRVGYFHHFYREYNEWFLGTLELVKKIPNVNWIIKDHPMGAPYKQDSYVKKVFMENQAPNIYWCDKGIGGMYIKEVADCIITCVGEAALEYWAYGIPTITMSKAYFSDWGISYNMKSLEEYEYTLKNLDTLKKPSDVSMKTAKKSLIALKRMSLTEDELAGMFLNTRKKQLEGYKYGTRQQDISQFCEEYMEFLRKSRIECSTVYQLNTIYDVS